MLMNARIWLVAGLAAGAAGCGGKVCDEAWDKLNACIQKLDCNKLGPLDRPKCEQARKQWAAIDETGFKAACSANSAEAEKIVACSLDPRTCQCGG
jgi:hypothetical protein